MPVDPELTRRRHGPNFLRFIVTGAVLGFFIGGLLGWTRAFEEPTVLTQLGAYSSSSQIGYLGLLGAGLGALVMAVVAVLLDRRS